MVLKKDMKGNPLPPKRALSFKYPLLHEHMREHVKDWDRFVQFCYANNINIDKILAKWLGDMVEDFFTNPLALAWALQEFADPPQEELPR